MTYGRLGHFDETLANANAGGHPGASSSPAPADAHSIRSPLSLRDRAAASASPIRSTPRRCFAPDGEWYYQFVFGDRRRHRQLQRSVSRGRQQPVLCPAAGPIRKHRDSGRHRQSPNLARDQSEHLSGSRLHISRRLSCPTPTKTGPRASINSAPASSGRSPRVSSWKRPTSATAARGLAGGAWAALSQISAATVRAIWFVPIPGTGPGGI